jgi:hypothetical protein
MALIPRLGSSFAQQAGELSETWRQRRKERRMREAMLRMDEAPEEAIQAVRGIDHVAGQNLAEKFEQRTQQNTLFRQGQDDRRLGQFKDGFRGMTGVMRTAVGGNKDADIGETFDSLTPLLTNGLGLNPDQIMQMREMVVANPNLLNNPEELVAKVLAPGAQLVQQTPFGANVLHTNPQADSTHVLRDGNGGSTLVTTPRTYGGQPAPGAQHAPQPGGPTGELPLEGVGAAPRVGGTRGGNGVPRGVRNNNRGNIEDGTFARSQPGYQGSDGRFAIFDTPENGDRAQENLLANRYLGQPKSVAEIINRYAPPRSRGGDNSEESVRNYVRHVEQRLGLQPGQKIDRNMAPQLAAAMREFENGTGAAASGGGGAAPAPGGGARIVAQTPGRVKENWRQLSPDEVEQRGLDTNSQWQVSPEGKTERIGGAPRAGARPGGDPAKRSAARRMRDGLVERNRRLRDVARRLLNHPGLPRVFGIVGAFPNAPGTAAADADALLAQLKGFAGFEELNQLRQLSPTGGALGNVSNFEVQTLQDSATGLKAAQSPRQAMEHIRIFIENSSRFEQLLNEAFNTDWGTPASSIPNAARERLRRNPSAEERRLFDEAFGPGTAAEVLRGR